MKLDIDCAEFGLVLEILKTQYADMVALDPRSRIFNPEQIIRIIERLEEKSEPRCFDPMQGRKRRGFANPILGVKA